VSKTWYSPPLDRPAALALVPAALAAATGLPVGQATPVQDGRLDLQVEVGALLLLVKYQAAATTAQVLSALWVLQPQKRGVPLLVVPTMGRVGREHCARAGVSWLDLSGNAALEAAGLRVRLLGQANRLRRHHADVRSLPAVGRHRDPPGRPG
jgi:hypothetical protein